MLIKANLLQIDSQLAYQQVKNFVKKISILNMEMMKTLQKILIVYLIMIEKIAYLMKK